MLDLRRSLLRSTVERDIQPGELIRVEGGALSGTVVGGTFGVKLTDGSAGEEFVGVSISQVVNPMQLPTMYKIVLDADKKGVVYNPDDDTNEPGLSHTPSGGTLIVLDSSNTPVASGTGTGEYQADGSGRVLTFGSDFNEGDMLSVAYRYSPTVAEAQALQGDQEPGYIASELMSRVGVVSHGDIYTTEFDTSVNWTGDLSDLRVTANGLFTLGGSGAEVDGYVIQVPSVGDAYLGVCLK